jgi:hypothetical protein
MLGGREIGAGTAFTGQRRAVDSAHWLTPRKSLLVLTVSQRNAPDVQIRAHYEDRSFGETVFCD